MNPKQLEHFASILQKEKQRLLEEITWLEETGLGDTMSDSLGELSVYDNHPADIADAMFERSKDVALRDNAHILLENVEAALDKIEQGTYGFCNNCGREIPLARLEAQPYATQCIDCQRESDAVTNGSPRPLEEDVLQPPFHRSFLDTANFDYVGFDGEDSLQTVLRYGSSDTPQDIPGSYNFKALWPNSNEHQGIVDLADAIPVEHYDTNKHTNEELDQKTDKKTEHP